MKKNGMKYIGFFLAMLLSAFTILPAHGADQCRVNDKHINLEYSGGCKDGLANGYGTAKGSDTYVGEFFNGNKHGKGVYTWLNGNRYEGQFEDDKFSGRGTLTTVSGNRYEGEWKNGKKNGKGTLIRDNGNHYEGGVQGRQV